jgi:hypothetical protein
MDEINKQDKGKFRQKLNEFKLHGLKSYGEYLANELAYSADQSNRKAYTSYIAKEIEKNTKKIQKLQSKMA